MHQPPFEESRPRFFGRRSGKSLRKQAQELMDTLLPRLDIPVPGQGDRLDPPALFPVAVSEVWLEVGFGGGEHCAWQAANRPDVGLIGCEVFRNGVASLLGHVCAGNLDNLRIFAEDARRLFPALPAASLSKVFVLFPDPWPKTRHAERRFICRDNLDAIARLLKAGGELRVASDDPVYQDWARAQLRAHEAFTVELDTTDRSALPADWPPTRYETKCLAKRAPVFFLARRR